MPRLGMVVLAPVVLVALFPAHSGYPQIAKHHVGLDVGYFKAFSDELKFDGFDFTNGVAVALQYRYSFSEMLDLALEVRGWSSSQQADDVTISLTNTFIGGGFRANVPGMAARPYIQANLYLAQEQASAEYEDVKVEAEVGEAAIGFGINGGVDIKVSNLISIPVEVMYLYADPGDNVSGIGFASGINFNFGRTKPPGEK
jgi:opacity protein-like surface antigen